MLNRSLCCYSSRIIIITLLLVIGLAPSTLHAQDWLTAYKNSVALYNTNETTKALAEAERSEQLYSKQYDVNNTNYRSILRQLSVINYDLYQLTQGIKYANREVNSWRKAITVNEVTYIDALDILGILYTANNQYDSAIIMLQEALNLATQTPNYNPEEKAIKGCHLAEALYGRGNLKQGYAQFKKSIVILDPLDEWPAEYLSFCYSFGKTCVAQKDYEAGIKYLGLMLEYYPPEYNNNPEVIDALIDLGKANTEQSAYSIGENHFNTALSRLQNQNSEDYIIITKLLADNLERQGKHSESKALLDKIGSSIETGSNQAALLLANQATILLNEGNATGAIHLFDSAILIIKNNSPIDKKALGNTSYNTAIAYRALGNKEKSIAYYGTAIESFPENSVVYQKALIGNARVYLAMGNKDEAATFITKLNLTNKEEWKPTEFGAIYNDLAGYYQSIGNYNKSSSYYKEALVAVPVKTSAQLYNNIAFNYLSLLQASGKFTEAEQLLVEIESSLKTSDPKLQYKFLQSIGNLYQAKGNFAGAEIQYNKALEIAGNTYGKSSNQYADILLRQATLAKDQGNYDASEPLFNQALSIVDNSSKAAAAIYNNLGILFQEMGRLDEAQIQFKTALKIYTTNSSSQAEYVVTEENLATLYSLKGNTKKALELLAETVSLNKSISGNESPNYAISLHNYASLLQQEKKTEEAKPLFEEALLIQKNSFGINHPSYANTLHNLAILAEDEKDYPRADSLLNKVIEIRAILYDENHPSYTAALFSRAVLKQQMNQFELAKLDFDKVANLYLDQIIKYFPNLSEKEKTAFYKKITPVFNRYKEFLLEYYVNFKKDETVLGQLYNIQIATKAILLNSINKTRNRILTSGNNQLISNFNEWQTLKKQLATYYTFSKSKLLEQGVEIDGYEAIVNAREKQLSAASQLFANEFDKNQVDWRTIQSQLKPDQIGVEFIRIKRNSNNQLDSITYIALAISPSFSNPKLVIYPNGKKLENKYLPSYTNSIIYKRQDNFSYTAYWEPLSAVVKDFKTVYLSPDGVFNKINANSFFDDKNNTYLTTSHNVRYISSTRDLLNTKPTTQTKNALLIADPFYPNSIKLASTNIERSYNFNGITQLPGTKIEVENIEDLMQKNGWAVNVLSDKTAKKQEIINESPTLLHIAAHGFFLQKNKENSTFLDNPLFRSGLLLAGAGDADVKVDNAGILTAYEVMNMNLDQTELVVLSACETALGDVQNGEGVYGLQRAFIIAGANTLIMSLWKVDDMATQKLMSAFYTYWLSGIDKHEALQKAQLDIQKEYEYPYYWAAFIMIGI